jgi:hypothetical protein
LSNSTLPPTTNQEIERSLDELLSSLTHKRATRSMAVELPVIPGLFITNDDSAQAELQYESQKMENIIALMDMRHKWKGAQPSEIHWDEVELAYRAGVCELLSWLNDCGPVIKWNTHAQKHPRSVWVQRPDVKGWKVVEATTGSQRWKQKRGLHLLVKETERSKRLKDYTIDIWVEAFEGAWQLCTAFGKS